MIRDPSDGSVKTDIGIPISTKQRPTSEENWGLKSLDREARAPNPAPTAEELRAHHATHNLGFKPKENT